MSSQFSFFQHTKPNDASADILTLFAQFVRQVTIQSENSYAMATKVDHFMNRHSDSLRDCIVELNEESRAVASLQKNLQKKMNAYLLQLTMADVPRTLKVK